MRRPYPPRRTALLKSLCLVAIAVTGCSKRVDDEQGLPESIPALEQPDYAEAVAQLQQQRADFREAYRLARGTAERREVIEEARQALVAGLFENLMPHWLGTPWDFNGISEVPGEGKIACGYFVSTLLRDAGLSVERIRMAQQASGQSFPLPF